VAALEKTTDPTWKSLSTGAPSSSALAALAATIVVGALGTAFWVLGST
jgi:hypothetical protein